MESTKDSFQVDKKMVKESINIILLLYIKVNISKEWNKEEGNWLIKTEALAMRESLEMGFLMGKEAALKTVP